MKARAFFFRLVAQFAGTNADYFLPDALGSVRQLTSITGSVTLAQRYDPYGGALSSVGNGGSAYGFTPAVSMAGAGRRPSKEGQVSATRVG